MVFFVEYLMCLTYVAIMNFSYLATVSLAEKELINYSALKRPSISSQH